MSGRLAGKVALVTGIGAGIGRGCALRFAREGATVIGCDIDAAWAAKTVADAADAGFVIDSVRPIDLTVPADVARYVASAADQHGRIDVVINAAAVNPKFAPVESLSYADIWSPTLRGEADLVFSSHASSLAVTDPKWSRVGGDVRICCRVRWHSCRRDVGTCCG